MSRTKKIIILIIVIVLILGIARWQKNKKPTVLPLEIPNNQNLPSNQNNQSNGTEQNTGNPNKSYNILAGDYNYSLTHDGLTRSWIVHVPELYDGKTATPLIMNFHGGGGNADNQINTSLMNDKSDEAGFIVVYPEGVPEPDKPNNKTFNAGNCCGAARDTKVDDIGFVKKMLADIESKFNIDKKRIYSTGYSNGAMLSHMLACEMSDTIAAIASIAGNLQVPSCNLTRPVSILEFHGTADRSVKYDGGTCGIAATGQSYSCKPVVTNMLDWAKRNSCNLTPKVTYENGDVVCKTYSACGAGTEVELCTIQDGGHTWPGGAYYPDSFIFKKVVGNLTQDISANDTMWEFFKKHPLP